MSMTFDQIQTYYNALSERFGNQVQSVSWTTEYTQAIRFEALSRIGDLETATVLDVGCGKGDLYRFLLDEGFKGDYIGVDISERMIDQARLQFPDLRWEVGNFLDPSFSITADYVLASGALSIKMPDHEAFLRQSIARLFSLCEKAVGFNLLSCHAPDNERYAMFYYADPLLVLREAFELTPYVELMHHYLPGDMSIFMYK